MTAEAAFLAALRRQETCGVTAVTDTWIDDLCAHDDRLSAEVRSLLGHLDAADESGSFLDPDELHGTRADAHARDAALEDWGGAAIGQRVGDFVILGRLGAGGMGVVYLAEQQRPRRTVALKLIRRSLATPAVVARFEREAELLGRLAHPGIAQIFAAGVADVRAADGGAPARVPYLAMERVEGLPIVEHVRAARSSPRHVVALLLQTCDAIHHAHQRGVIHRDLKPANLLVAPGDVGGSPRVKVLDFGVARAIGGGAEGSATIEESLTQLTGHGHLLGTPAYMSPEQIAGRGHEATAAADVYALGAILFQLLTGQHAIDLAGCPLHEVARRVVEIEPPRLGTIDRALRGDLEQIVAKALAKNPVDRYPTAAAMGGDLQLHLDGRSISVRRDGWVDPCVRLLARHRTRLAMTAIAGVACVAAIGFALHEASEHRRADAVARALADQLAESRIELAFAKLAGTAGITWAEPAGRRGLPAREPSGRWTATLDDDGVVRVSDATTRAPLAATSPRAIAARGRVRFDRAAAHVAAAFGDGTIDVWSIATEDGAMHLVPLSFRERG